MGSSYYLILRGAWIIHIFYSFFSVVRKGTKEKRCFFFFVSTKKQLAKMTNFLNIYCNRIYTKQKLFSFCSPTPPHKLWKKQILLVKNVYSISPNNALFIHFYFFSLYNRTSYYFFSLDFFVYCCAFILFFPMFFLYFSKHFLYIWCLFMFHIFFLTL